MAVPLVPLDSICQDQLTTRLLPTLCADQLKDLGG
jgi:hypothetical protein